MNTAFAINAIYFEVVFEGFEEYDPKESIDKVNIGNGNIDFTTSQ